MVGTRRVDDVLVVFVDAFYLISVEVVEGLTYFGYGNDVAPLSVAYELCVVRSGECLESVAVEGDLEGRFPFEVAGEGCAAEFELKTLVLDFAVVALGSGESRRAVALCSHI